MMTLTEKLVNNTSCVLSGTKTHNHDLSLTAVWQAPLARGECCLQAGCDRASWLWSFIHEGPLHSSFTTRQHMHLSTHYLLVVTHYRLNMFEWPSRFVGLEQSPWPPEIQSFSHNTSTLGNWGLGLDFNVLYMQTDHGHIHIMFPCILESCGIPTISYGNC